MRIFKFGGASVKDAAGVKNVVQVLDTMGHENTSSGLCYGKNYQCNGRTGGSLFF